MNGIRPGRKGFTLVELMVVVGIIGLLVSIAIYGYAAIKRRVARKACQMNMRKIYEATQWLLTEETISTDENIMVHTLLDRGYLKPPRPRCKLHKGTSGFYAIEEKSDGRIIVKCVNIGGEAHGTFNFGDDNDSGGGSGGNGGGDDGGGDGGGEE